MIRCDHLPSDGLTSVIEEGDIRVLLMVLFHVTGDRRWLEPPYRPRRDTRLIPDPGAGLPRDLQREIRSAIVRLFEHGIPEPAVVDPGDELMTQMMSVCLGEAVDSDYAPLVREEMGLKSRDVEWTRPAVVGREKKRVLIVGAGVSGIALAIRLKRQGIPYLIVERNDDIGGTWHVNRYPGCGVDTPNHSYSYSFYASYPWSRYFSPREEIHDYLHRVVEHFDLRPDIRFRTRLMEARWDEERGMWISRIEGPNGVSELETAVLVSAIGQFNTPSIPRIEGADSFLGRAFHSAEWPDDVDVKDLRVAVIGTGATAMQLVPTIAADVASVTVYQRSAQWARPIEGYSDPIGEGAKWLLEHLPFYAPWFRFGMFWRYGDGLLPFLRKDPDWPHQDRSINLANDRHRQEMVDFIQSELGERQDLLADCIPSYPPFGKRILLDNGWYRTLLRPNVELVSEPIERIVPEGIKTQSGVREADLIVYSTGFRMGEMTAQLNVTGRGGVDLADAWKDDDPSAYLGITVPGFPNMFCMLGPNAGLAHGGSVMFQAECQARYISGTIAAMVEADVDAIEVRRDVHDDYVARVDAAHEQLIWTHPGVGTYYRNEKGRVFSVMPWRLIDYWAMTHEPDLADYEIRRERVTGA